MSTHSLMVYIILFAAVFVDCREHRIPNWLVGYGLALGLIYSLIAPAQSIAIGDALLGLLVGFLVLLPGYVLGKMGAGDVKLMAVCGCYLGAEAIFNATLVTFVAGGVFGLAWVLFDKLPNYYGLLLSGNRYFSSSTLVSKLTNATPVSAPSIDSTQFEPAKSIWKQHFPYALAIAFGCLTVMFTGISVFAR